MIIHARSVDQALHVALTVLLWGGAKDESRNGSVLRLPEPVVTCYAPGYHYVSTNPIRNANPFFHFFEALWMLAGRDDLKFITKFNKRMAEYSDDGITQPAAYGKRWRGHFGIDQIKFVIDHLNTYPHSRRAVITMADPSTDTQAVYKNGKDVPCNTNIYFLIRNGALEMTVCCRSNDAIWGAYGANAVHMATLHAYVAAWLRVPTGAYYQISNDLHVYTDVFSLNDLEEMRTWEVTNDQPAEPLATSFGQMEAFDLDLRDFFRRFDGGAPYNFRTVYFAGIVDPMMSAWRAYKAGDRSAASTIVRTVDNQAWREACTAWLNRAWRKKDAKHEH